MSANSNRTKKGGSSSASAPPPPVPPSVPGGATAPSAEPNHVPKLGVPGVDGTFTRLIAAGIKVSSLKKAIGHARNEVGRSTKSIDIEIPVFSREDAPITQAMVNAYGASQTADDMTVRFVTEVELTAPTGKRVVTARHNSGKEKSQGVSSGPKSADACGGFGEVETRAIGKEYQDPLRDAADRVKLCAETLKIELESATTGAAFLDRMIADVLGRYNATKGDLKPFIKTGANVLLTCLAGAATRMEMQAYKDAPKGCLAPIFTQTFCVQAQAVLKTPATGAGKLQKGSARLSALFQGKTVTTYEASAHGITQADNTAFPVLAGEDDVCKAVNFVLFLCSFCNRSLKNESIAAKFMTFDFTTAATSKERPWVDLILTHRIQVLSSQKDVPLYAQTGSSLLRKAIEEPEHGESYGARVCVQPALAGFRSYITNLSGKSAKTAGRITGAIGATYKRGDVMLNRLDAFVQKVGQVPHEQAEKLMHFITTCSEADFARIVAP